MKFEERLGSANSDWLTNEEMELFHPVTNMFHFTSPIMVVNCENILEDRYFVHLN